MSLNWQNDPLLLDEEPKQINDWATANKLLGKKKLEEYAEDNHRPTSNEGKWFFPCNDNGYLINLYSILVRKIDFIREKDSDRILSRFPFLVLSQEEKESIKEKVLLIAEFSRDYFHKSINSRIMDWKRRLETYLKRGAMPYPLYRSACAVLEWSTVNPHTDKLFFESARGKRYSVPTKLTKALAYLCGACNGDGHLKQHWLRIVDETKEHIAFLSQVFEHLFSDSGEIFKTKNSNAWNAELRCTAAVRLINFLTDQTINGTKYDSLREPLVFRFLGEPYRRLYWRGTMDADGSYYDQIAFSSTSKQYILDFKEYLSSINIKSKIFPMQFDAYMLKVPIDFKIPFACKIGALNPKKKKDFCKLLQRKSIIFNGLIEGNVTSNGYFDFTKLQPIHVNGLSSILREIRGKKTYNTIELELSITRGQYRHYEHATRAIPMSLLFQLFNIQNDEAYLLMKKIDALPNKKEITFQSSTSKPIRLPLKPTSDVLMIMSHLIPLSNWTRILQPTIEMKNKIEGIFGLIVKSRQIRSNILLRFLTTFGDYTEINTKELISDDI